MRYHYGLKVKKYLFYIFKIINLGPWEKDGEKTLLINKSIMEFIACDIQPLSVVENIGFIRLISQLQPKYNIPSRFYFTNNLMPDLVDKIKVNFFLFSPVKKTFRDALKLIWPRLNMFH